MGQKKDIGTLFENKLNEGKRTPNNSLWEKINISLDEEKRKRKKIILYWLVGGGLSVLIGVLLVFDNGSFLMSTTPPPQNNATLNERSLSPSEGKNEKSEVKILSKNALSQQPGTGEKLSKISTVQENTTENNEENSLRTEPSPEPAANHETRKLSSKKNDIDDTFNISEMYYYYNSLNGKQIITANKKEVDSLISEKQKSLDSTALNKTIIPVQ
ncbi:hypothetical protein [Aequorivita lipolytica]|uniref:Uncharacterized protein n=1 Tax=Aequorivita lipolytica TaxID=153267 RepID=A0A5C6YS31_9FLAO|nr:hypothetical protein [Aequorivita lipolytica]TXD69758.1 hypothetical protein ESV24_04780 [Aequorivita lipolytica]SRX50433.1 hypothetical protein AEQU2_00906 [Aequorivita lipolytica]